MSPACKHMAKHFAALLLFLSFAAYLPAQGITWGTNATISADTDVFTDGTLLYAYDWANANTTVNGIAFTGTTSANPGNVSMSGIGSNYGGYTSASTPFSNLSAAYQSILKGGEYALSSGITATITLNNLTVGRVYAVQIWVGDPRASGGEAGRTENAGGSNSVTLAYNVPPSPGGVGQYSIGVFTATGSTETFTLLSNGTSGSTQLNALLVSDVTATGYQPVNPAQPGSSPQPSAQWVHFGTNGLLSYYADSLGNRLPDFSYAGYMQGGVSLPVLPVKMTISPVNGDNTASIQNAINSVSSLTPDANGYRGALLLNPGIYTIAGNLFITNSGVVLRGSGDNTNNGTVLLFTGDSRNVFTVGGTSSLSQSGTSYSITNAYLPLGATNFGINGSSIIWGTNVTISGDADVYNGGTLLYAYDWANNNTTVNGVAFTGTTSANPGNVSISGIGGNYGAYSSSSAPFSNLSAAYQNILKGAEYGSGNPTATMTLNNLTAGHVYAVQVWVSDPRGGGTVGRTETFASYNQVTLAYNVPPATGGVGEYSIGVFTATGSSQTFSFTASNSSGSTQINALLVSDVTGIGFQPVNPSPAASAFSVGEDIVIQRPQTQPWINAIAMNTLTNPWSPGTGLKFEREITAVNGNQITVDAPLCNPIESAWTTGLVYQVTDSGRIQNVGIENLCGVGQMADYPSNILNGTFITYQNLKNCWIHDVLMSGWGNGITLNDKWCTVQDCIYTNPATGTASAAPAAYTFNSSAAQSLFQRCTSYGGYYHIMVTQAGTPGPDVFLNFNCQGTHYNGGPHQRWAAGALHDNILMAADTEGDYTPYLAVNNRGNDGSGQGWSAGFSVMYNCQVPQFQLEQPNTTTNQYNWTIGGIGSEESYSDEGIYDTLGTIVSPHSLYLEQLKERLGPAAIQNIGYTVFTMGATPATQTVGPGNNISFTVNVAGTNYFTDTVALNVAGLPSGASATFNPNSIAGTGSSTLTIVASNSVVTGNYLLTINAVDENLTNSMAVNLSVVPLTPPQFTLFQFKGKNLVMSGTNGVPNGIYFVLATTNLALPIAQWTILSTNAFTSAGNFNVTNPVPAGSQQYFLLRAQ